MSDAIGDYLNSIAQVSITYTATRDTTGPSRRKGKELKDLERPLTTQERRELRSGQRARQRFMQSNLQLVVHVARKLQQAQQSDTGDALI
jgi:DNA-directed RNA polymerase sigma subunit (sigma70/sigma32)